MAKTTSGITFASLMQQLQLRQYAPIYLLMGDESYYIDKVVEFMENNILNEADREFNQIIHYANDKTEANVDLVSAVINEARRYPMMGDKQVIFLRECQSLDKKNLFDKLALYLENPQPTSIIVLTYKHGSADKRKKWVSAVEKVGVVFESKKLYENEASIFITDCAKKNDLKISPDANRLLLELVGTDLTQIESIMKKFSIMLTKDRTITPEIVEQTTGVNKDYTPFELLTAIINGDARKANRIILNTSANIVAIIAILFNYFSNLFIYEYMADHSPAHVASVLKINPYRVKEFEMGVKRFTKMKCFKIIGYLREYDCKSKGIGAAGTPDVDLLKELIYKILN